MARHARLIERVRRPQCLRARQLRGRQGIRAATYAEGALGFGEGEVMRFEEWFEKHAPPYMSKAFDLRPNTVARMLFDLGRLYEQHFPQGPGPVQERRFVSKPRHLKVVK